MRKKSIAGVGMKMAPWVLLAPNLFIFATFIIVPAVIGFGLSFYKWDGLAQREFIGISNYVKAMNSSAYWSAMGRTVLYAAICVPLVMVVALFLANLLIKPIRGVGFFRAAFYWPTMISFIITGLSYKFLFGDSFGVINYLLEAMGRDHIPWLTNSSYTIIVVVLATVWSRAGFYMVTFISGLQSIPTSYYEACEVDGANAVQRFFWITLPLLKPTTFLVLILSMIDMIKAYPLINALTGGGPNRSTTYIVQHIYEEAFVKSNMGYASALSMLLFVILAVFTAIQFKVNRGGEIK